MSQVMSVHIEGLLPLKRQMELLMMPEKLRRRLLNKVAKKVISDSKARTRKQVDINGRPFVKHSKGRKRKMLTRLTKQLKVTRLSGSETTIGFNNSLVAAIAAKQQYGYSQAVNANSFKDINGASERYDNPATRKQGKALREAGFRINKSKGKKGKLPSLKWVTSNLTVGIAGLILKNLRIANGEEIKSSWVTKIPARPFLGVSKAKISEYIDLIFKQMKKEVQHGIR